MSKVSQLALIALGSNDSTVWGDPRETVQKAMVLLGQLSDHAPNFSKLYQTPAFPAGAGPDFVNASVALFTKLRSADLLAKLHEIEGGAGRVRTVRWGQRTLDLDLIALGSEVSPDEHEQTKWRDLPLSDQLKMTPSELILPHPRLQDRAFVLVPLRDIAPDWQHPILHKTVAQMCAALPASDRDDVVQLA